MESGLYVVRKGHRSTGKTVVVESRRIELSGETPEDQLSAKRTALSFAEYLQGEYPKDEILIGYFITPKEMEKLLLEQCGENREKSQDGS